MGSTVRIIHHRERLYLLLGVWLFFAGDFLDGLWLGFIGWFLL